VGPAGGGGTGDGSANPLVGAGEDDGGFPPADLASSNGSSEAGPPVFRPVMGRRACQTNGAGGEACYFRDALVCVGFPERRRVGIVVPTGDKLWVELAGAKGRGRPRVDPGSHEQVPFLPAGFRIGLNKSTTYVGTHPLKRWPDMVSGGDGGRGWGSTTIHNRLQRLCGPLTTSPPLPMPRCVLGS
jgi:hypothetical protein